MSSAIPGRKCFSDSHVVKKELSQGKTIGLAIFIILCLSCLALSVVGLGGYLQLGSLSDISQINSIIMMAAGGGGGIICLIIGIVRFVKNYQKGRINLSFCSPASNLDARDIPEAEGDTPTTEFFHLPTNAGGQSSGNPPITSTQPEVSELPEEMDGGTVYGPEAWNHWNVQVAGNVPSVPKIAWDSKPLFLQGQSLKEACMLVFIPEKIIFKGKELRLTLNLLEEIRGEEYALYDPSIRTHYGTIPIEPGWILMTKDIIPGSTEQNYDNQEGMVGSDGFCIPKAGEFVIGLSMQHARMGRKNRYGYVQEKVQDRHVVVGTIGSRLAVSTDRFIRSSCHCGCGAVLRDFKVMWASN
jgi:hypothetical protein